MKDMKNNALTVSIRAIPRAVKAAFLCCFVAGFLIHIFAFTNIIPNSDGLSRVADAQQMTVSGRWFLHYASAFNGFVQMPAVIGFFSVFFMSLAAALVCSLLELKSSFLGGLTGVLMIAFPSVAYTYLYMFTASAYFFGIALAVLAVFLCRRFKYGFLFGAVPLACAVGTYQAYIAVAVSLCLLSVLLFALDRDTRAKQTWLLGLRYLLLLALGMLLYYLVLRVFLWAKDLTLLDYRGISSALSGFSVSGIAHGVYSAYRQFIGYFFVGGQYSSYTGPFLILLNALSCAAALGSLIFLAIREKLCRRTPGKFAAALLACLLLPLGLCLTSLMGETTPVMEYSLVFAYIAALALVDRACEGIRPGIFRLRSAVGLVGVLIVVCSFQTDNLAYTVSAQAHRASESFATRLVQRVEDTEGYQEGMQVVIIGGFPDSVYYCDIPAFRAVESYSCLSSSVMPLNKHIYYYLNDWLNVPWEEPDEETMIAVAGSSAFQAMPLYPDDGSIVLRDGRVIVKLAETYTPKSDYEIAYENRR